MSYEVLMVEITAHYTHCEVTSLPTSLGVKFPSLGVKSHPHRCRPGFASTRIPDFNSDEVVVLLNEVVTFRHARVDYSPALCPWAIRIEDDAFSG